MSAVKLTDQDLKAIRQMVRLEVRLAIKRMYDQMVYEYPPPSPSFTVVGETPTFPKYPGPMDMDWVEEGVE